MFLISSALAHLDTGGCDEAGMGDGSIDNNDAAADDSDACCDDDTMEATIRSYFSMNSLSMAGIELPSLWKYSGSGSRVQVLQFQREVQM